MKPQPVITRTGFLNIQVCVPKDMSDVDVKAFADKENPAGTEHGWFIQKEGHEALNGDPERVQCDERKDCCHIMLEC